MVITKIEAQKKKGRYNIYLNDAFAFGVDEATVVKYTLFKGTELKLKKFSRMIVFSKPIKKHCTF